MVRTYLHVYVIVHCTCKGWKTQFWTVGVLVELCDLFDTLKSVEALQPGKPEDYAIAAFVKFLAR